MLSDRIRAPILTTFIIAGFLLVWHGITLPPRFDATGLSEDDLMLMEFNGGHRSQ